mmetsp:Transcript_10110/g.30889  ORF Transcript_10110/g.30889 Transcript_10110/m.30889 type:complete len:573 (+) Transcript_10110:45-1763(+)
MVVTHPTSGDQLCIGMDLVTVPKVRDSLETAEALGCDFIVAPLVHPRFERATMVTNRSGYIEHKAPRIERDLPLTRSDMDLNSGEWIDGVIGKLSPWIRPGATSKRLRLVSEEALLEEYSLASHLSLKAVVTPLMNSRSVGANYARCINSALARGSPTQIWVRIPVAYPPSGDADNGSQSGLEGAWEVWNFIRTLCDSHANLGLALELTSDLPPKALIERWFAEPVHMLVVSTSAFVTNKAGYPVLQRRHKDFVTSMFRHKCLFSISGRVGNVNGGEGVRPFVMFLAHLFGKQPGGTNGEAYDAPYLDYLQAPLQPLADNLESSTYETFEKDLVKYARYREAIRRYLLRASHSRKVVALVLGAGRGPLVRACLEAAEEVGSDIFIYAVEKNPHAVITLRNLRDSYQWSNVKVVPQDMRSFTPPEKADLIVSELLGSFGDNELSPECLARASELLNKNGVCIPQNSTSFLAPLCSHTLYSSVRSFGGSRANFETPYVVKIHRGVQVTAAKPCFRFEHPETEVSTPKRAHRPGLFLRSDGLVSTRTEARELHQVHLPQVSCAGEQHGARFCWVL